MTGVQLKGKVRKSLCGLLVSPMHVQADLVGIVIIM